MMILRPPTSAIALEIVDKIKNFIVSNQELLMKADRSISPDDGATALANAIAYGVAKALSSNAFTTALELANVGLSLPATPPATPPTTGTVLKTAISAVAKEI